MGFSINRESLEKIGRNDPCWCGSGKKYKKCHLNRQQENRIQPWEIMNATKNISSKYCSVPTNLKSKCCGDIINAHTVSKSANLKKISRDGHVYAFLPTFEKLNKHNGVAPAELVGINKASTFTGFCAFHDKEIFSLIEDQEFIASKEQCFLLAYRALAREIFAKKNVSNLLPFFKKLDQGRISDVQQEIQMVADAFSQGTLAGMNTIESYKNKFDDILNNNDFADVKACIINFRNMPNVLCSGGIFPEYDFQGNRLQDLSDLGSTPDFLTFSTIATTNGGAVVFCWINDSGKEGNSEKLVNSLKKLDGNDLTNSLIRLFFEHCENIFIAPLWWESLEEDQKQSLTNRLLISGSVAHERSPSCLCDDGFKFDNWTAINIQEL
jgi:SEC-C motif